MLSCKVPRIILETKPPTSIDVHVYDSEGDKRITSSNKHVTSIVCVLLYLIWPCRKTAFGQPALQSSWEAGTVKAAQHSIASSSGLALMHAPWLQSAGLQGLLQDYVHQFLELRLDNTEAGRGGGGRMYLNLVVTYAQV